MPNKKANGNVKKPSKTIKINQGIYGLNATKSSIRSIHGSELTSIVK